MAEDRMLSDEVLLALIKKNSGGGGGGTSNYNDLSNQPQINGNTLVGNKSASDLGLVAAETGKGLSSNDYTNEDKAIVEGVPAALAGKQDALTAGKYINIDANNEISVDPVVPNEAFTYTIQQIGDGIVKITKTVSGAVVFEKTYNGNADITLDALHYVYSNGVQSYTLLIASDTHEAGFKQIMSWWARDTFTENFSTVDHSGEKLIIKSEMDDALALKQDKTDNSLQTTDKTVVGAVNELKSGLTNYENQNDLNLEVPNRKNLLNLKALQVAGSTISIVDDTVTVHGTASWSGCKDGSDNNLKYKAGKYYVKFNVVSATDYSYIGVGFRNGNNQFINSVIRVTESGQYSDVIEISENGYFSIVINDDSPVDNTVVIEDIMVSPYDEAYAPYIPSVESRIEALENSYSETILTIENANITAERKSVKRFGSVCVIDLIFTVSTAITNDRALLFSGAPKAKVFAENNFRFTAVEMTNANIVPAVMNIDNNGKVYNQWTTGGIQPGVYTANATYICQ